MTNSIFFMKQDKSIIEKVSRKASSPPPHFCLTFYHTLK